MFTQHDGDGKGVDCNEVLVLTSRRNKLFLICTFIVTWTSWWLLAYFTQESIFDFQSIPAFGLFILGGSAPTVAAYLAVYFTQEEGTVKEFNSRVFKYKVGVTYYGYALFVPPILGLIGMAFASIFGHDLQFEASFDLLMVFIPSFFIAILLGGLEELGWRGVLQPALTTKYNLLVSNFIIGLMWSLWHLPLFYIVGTVQSETSFLLFSINAIGFSSFLTWLYFKKKSILLCVLLHASLNATGMTGLSAPLEDSTLFLYHALIVFGLGTALMVYESMKSNDDLSKDDII